MKCLAEIVKPGDVAVIKGDPSSDVDFVGREVVILGHRPHEAGDLFCVEVEHPDMPEKVMLIRAKRLDFTNLRQAP